MRLRRREIHAVLAVQKYGRMRPHREKDYKEEWAESSVSESTTQYFIS